MTTHIGIGFSQNADAEKAAQEATLQAIDQVGRSTTDFTLILSTTHYSPQKTLPVIKEHLTSSKTIGCSTSGIILSSSVETRGLAVLTIKSDVIKFGIGSATNITLENSHQSGTNMAQNSLADFGQHRRQAFLFFMDGQLSDSSLLLKGLQDIMGNVFPIVGAGCSDDFHFSNTFQIFQNNVLTQSATGLIVGGQIGIGVAGRHGWRPLGKPRLITKVDKNIIRTIDNKKAALLYKEYFGEEAKNLQSSQLGQMAILYPLGIFVEGSNEYLLRNAIDILPDGSIVCQGNVPENTEVHIMIGNKDSCKQAALQAAKEAKQNLLGKETKFIIILESMARLKLLGRKAFQEIQYIKGIFGQSVPLIGMYSHGEICPFQTTGKIKKPLLQNESIVILAIG